MQDDGYAGRMGPEQQRIFDGLVKSAHDLGGVSGIVVIGSYPTDEFDDAKSDLDIFLTEAFVKDHLWAFIERMRQNAGVVSVYRVKGRALETADGRLAHPLALTLRNGSCTKTANLDLLVPAHALRHVAGSIDWMYAPWEQASPANHRRFHAEHHSLLTADEVDEILDQRTADPKGSPFQVHSTSHLEGRPRVPEPCRCVP